MRLHDVSLQASRYQIPLPAPARLRAGLRRLLGLLGIGEGAALGGDWPWREWLRPHRLAPSLFGVKRRDVVELTQDISVLVESGVPMSQALSTIEEQISKRAVTDLLSQVAADLQAGGSLSGALAKHPKVFGNVYCQFVRAGEETGNLGASLKDASLFLERREAIGSKAAAALLYPAIVLAVSAVIVIVMFTAVLPPLLALFESMDSDLPLPTRVLLGLTNILGGRILYFGGGLTLAAIALVLYTRSAGGRIRLHRAVLKAPLIGPVKLQIELARAMGVMTSLGRAGVPMSDILDLVAEASSNESLRYAFRQVGEGLREGKGIAEPMAATGRFPLQLVRVMKMGEETGTLESNLEQLAAFYHARSEEATQRMLSLVEPLSTLAVALGVGFIALAVIMPMYSVLGSLDS